MNAVRVVNFLSGGFKLEADFYLPEANGEEKLPAILLCHGFSGVRHELLPEIAKRFAAAGYAILAPDYRGFGGSEGPVALVDPFTQLEDLRSALTWLEIQPEIDPARLGVWGTSNGGAHIVYLSGIDNRVKAAVGQVGYGDGRELMLGHKTEAERTSLLDKVHADRIARLDSPDGGTIQILELVSSRQSRDFMEAAGATAFEIAIRSAETTMLYRPKDVAGDIRCALKLMGAESDDLCPAENYRAVYELAQGPKEWKIFPIGHYDFYTPDGLDMSTREALSWYSQHL